jgi:hypothetical protein
MDPLVEPLTKKLLERGMIAMLLWSGFAMAALAVGFIPKLRRRVA